MTFEEAKNYYGEAFARFYTEDGSFDPDGLLYAIKIYADTYCGSWENLESFTKSFIAENYLDSGRQLDKVVGQFIHVNYKELTKELFYERDLFREINLSTGWIAVFRNF